MKIKYIGSATVRTVGEYCWNASNGFVQDVKETELATNLLTYPRPEFEAVDEVSEEVISFVEGEVALPKKKVRGRRPPTPTKDTNNKENKNVR